MQQITTGPRHHTNSSQKQSRNLAYCQGKYSKEKTLDFFFLEMYYIIFSLNQCQWRPRTGGCTCFLQEALTNIVSYLLKVSIIKGKVQLSEISFRPKFSNFSNL